jgi:hypothetical protein
MFVVLVSYLNNKRFILENYSYVKSENCVIPHVLQPFCCLIFFLFYLKIFLLKSSSSFESYVLLYVVLNYCQFIIFLLFPDSPTNRMLKNTIKTKGISRQTFMFMVLLNLLLLRKKIRKYKPKFPVLHKPKFH